jgi:hypothetical protein
LTAADLLLDTIVLLFEDGRLKIAGGMKRAVLRARVPREAFFGVVPE